jgi:hypothetical protein
MSASSRSFDEEDGFSVESGQGLDGHDDALPGDLEAVSGEAAAVETGPPADTYWTLSRTPLTSLAFTMPLVLAYEGGVLLLGRGSPRNGADVWLRHLLDALGFGGYFLLPLLTIVGLLAWHHVEHDRWRFRPAVLVGMCLECLILAAVLVGLARLQSRLWPLDVTAGLTGLATRFVGFCGAGLYEEVLFRLLLLPAVGWTIARLGAAPPAAVTWAVFVTSVLFAAAHYIGPLGDTFDLHSFAFRTLAGLFFAALFLARGFGIAAGTHAVYDMIVGLV